MKRQFLLTRMLLLFALIVGSGSNAWATGTTAQVTSATATNGGNYVIAIYYDGDYYAIPGASTITSSNTYSGVKLTLNAIGKVNTSDATDITWTLNEGTTTGQFSIKSGTKYLIKSGTTGSSNYKINTSTTAEYWEFSQQNNTYKTYEVTSKKPSATVNLKLTNNSMTVGCYSSVSSYITLLEIGDVPTYALTISSPENGNISVKNGNEDVSSGDKFAAGTTLTVTATPNSGYVFSAWTGTTSAYTNTASASTTFTMPSSTATINATFNSASDPAAVLSETALAFGDVEVGKTKDMTFTITPANLTSALTIASGNNKYTVSPTSIAQDVTTTQTITVTAAPTALNDDMDGAITISGGGLASNKTVTLSASPYQVSTVTLSATNGVIQQGGVTKTSITSRVGNTVTVTAVPNSGYIFDSWTATGATPASSDDAETEFTLSATAVTLTANFIADPYSYAVLDETEIPKPAAAVSYADAVEQTITQDGFDWIFKGCKTKDLKTLQIRAATSDGESYIKLPALPGAIKTIVFSVTNGSAASKTGTATTTVLSLRLGSGTTNGTLVASSGSTSSNTKTIDLSELPEKYSTGYITASGSIRIWDITVSYLPAEDINVSVSDAKYATFSDYVARNFSGKGITVYTAKSDGTKVNLTEVEDGIVPANKGVVLYSASVLNNVAIPVATTDPSDYDDANNELVGINVRTLVAKTASTKTNYILSNEASGVGFYLAADDGAYLPAHRAYLSTTSPAASRSFLGFDDETTGIETIKTNPETVSGVQEYYNLNGQRVTTPTKGLYIVNGKKVIINK